LALEPRHESWYEPSIEELLREHDVALCLTDRRGKRLQPLWRTSSWTYLRFHEGRATPRPCYGTQALRTWARRLVELWGTDAEAWVYFNNDRAAARHATQPCSDGSVARSA